MFKNSVQSLGTNCVRGFTQGTSHKITAFMREIYIYISMDMNAQGILLGGWNRNPQEKPQEKNDKVSMYTLLKITVIFLDIFT